MTPKKLFKGCLITLGIFVVIVFGLGIAFSSSDSTSVEEVPTHQCPGVVQSDETILVAGKYTLRTGPNGIGVTLPKFSQPPYFILHFKEPTQVFETQELKGADLSSEYRYALDGDWKEENGKYTFWSGSHFIFRHCLVESVTNIEAIDAQIRGGYPFHIIMENFGRDIVDYITSIDICINQEGKEEIFTFYPNDGQAYKKNLIGLLHQNVD